MAVSQIFWTSEQPDLFLTGPFYWGCTKTYRCSKERNLSQSDWKPDPQAASFKVCKYIQSYLTSFVSPTGFQGRKCPMSDSCKNWSSRQVYKLLFGGTGELYWGQGWAQRWLLQPTSRETPIASKCVANLKPAPQADVLGQVNRPFPHADCACISIRCMCSALGGGSLPRTVSLIVSIRGGPEMQAPAIKARQSRCISCVSVWTMFMYIFIEAAGKYKVRACPPALLRQ